MRHRLLFVLVAFLVNLPLVHDTWVNHEISADGHEVQARVVRTSIIGGHPFVEYQLPRRIDPARKVYTARVDEQTYTDARQSRVVAARVVPGKPVDNRLDGAVTGQAFLVVAIVADVILLVIFLLLRRRSSPYRPKRIASVDVAAGTVAVDLGREPGGVTVTCTAPPHWLERAQAGSRVAGLVHLVAESDLVPSLPVDALEHGSGSTYFVRARILDVRRGVVDLELDHGPRTSWVLPVETGSFRNRADLRDHAEVTGTLMFTPRR